MGKLKPPLSDYENEKPVEIIIEEIPRSFLDKLLGMPKYWIYVSKGMIGFREPLTALSLKEAKRKGKERAEKHFINPKKPKVVYNEEIKI